MERYFQISCHALMISAFFALAMTGRLDAPAIVLFTIGLGLSCYRSVRGLPPPLSGRGAFVVSCAYILFFPLDMTFLSRSFITASIHLVLFLHLVKIYQKKEDRDYFYLIVLSFLQILAASALTIDMSFVVTLFLFLVALVSTLMSLEMYRAERNSQARAQQVAMPLGGTSLWATVWIIVTGLILFLIIPRVGAGYFTRATSESLLVSGFNDTVQLGEISQVKLSSAIVMHARQVSGTPFAVVKWRGIALDRFDGRNWLKTDRKRHPLLASRPDFYPVGPTQGQNQIRYEILLEPLATNALFGPHEVRAISGRLQTVEVDSDDSIYLRYPPARRIQYEVYSEHPDPTRALPNRAGEDQIPADIAMRYLQLPEEIDPRIAQLAAEITSNGKSIVHKASLIEGYLKRNYTYTLSLTWDPGQQPLSTFLFDAKKGHCEYFASSMAILLRSAGIPTRLVNGFLMGEYNSVGENYIVRQADAHSWVEVYVPGSGWMEFDPTPPDPNRRDIDFAMQISHYVDAMQMFWNSYVLIYDSGAQMQLFRSAQDRVQTVQAAIREKADRSIARVKDFTEVLSSRLGKAVGTGLFWIILTLLAGGGVTYRYRRSARMLVQAWRIRRGRGAVTDDLVEQLFYRATRLAERATKRRTMGETWREWVSGLPDPRRRSILSGVLVIFEKSKYGHLPISSTDFAALENAIRELKVG